MSANVSAERESEVLTWPKHNYHILSNIWNLSHKKNEQIIMHKIVRPQKFSIFFNPSEISNFFKIFDLVQIQPISKSLATNSTHVIYVHPGKHKI
jgi:hypothetical protein